MAHLLLSVFQSNCQTVKVRLSRIKLKNGYFRTFVCTYADLTSTRPISEVFCGELQRSNNGKVISWIQENQAQELDDTEDLTDAVT
mmetsp:Transcript_21502/g.29250  ORF Transcript_21502/g.29250 Transcript_21502/m.29250 type:complete len:86 (+) Transcript_21502:589-846(+)